MFPEIARPGAVPPTPKPSRAAGPAPSGTTDPLLLDDGVLTLRDEKLSETEDKDRQFPERFYGRFDRRIPWGYEIDGNTAEAGFRNGVLTVTLPRTEKAQSQVKLIPIKG